jgi:hypothetical protein
MLVRYDDGKQQLVTVAIQARIWQRYQDESAPQQITRKPISDADSLDIQPVIDLVRDVLASLRSYPYPEDIIDQLCLAIEANPQWQDRYDNLVEHYSSKGKHGKLTVNSNVGWYTRDETGLVNLGTKGTAKSSLITSFSRLGIRIFPEKNDRIRWKRTLGVRGNRGRRYPCRLRREIG